MCVLSVPFVRLDFASSVQVNFEKPDSGFFFKHSAVQSNNNNNPIVDIKNNPIAAKENQDSILSFNRFTVAQANHPVSIRASYGPFSTKQTVPARYIVPEDAADNYGYHTQVKANLPERRAMAIEANRIYRKNAFHFH